MRRIQVFAALAAAALFAAPAAAQPPRHGSPDMWITEHAERLGLDAKQLAAIKSAVAHSHEQNGAMHKRVMEAHRKLRDLLNEPMPDEAAVMAQADKVNAVEAEMMKHRLATTLEIRGLLTESQRTELVKVMAERNKEQESRRAGHEAMIAASCAPDIARFCADEEAGPGREMCLKSKNDELSPACGAAMSARGPHGPPRGPRTR